MKIIFLITIFISSLFANDYIAKVIKLEGKVKIIKNGEIKKTLIKLNDTLKKDDLIITYKKANVTLQLKDSSLVTLDEKSKLLIQSDYKLFQKSGNIYYNIQKRDLKGLKVATNFSIIGVKGTQFIVKDSALSKSVALKEGLVELTSLEKEFKIYKDDIYNQIENFKNEFEQYKKKEQDEFATYKKSFDLKPNKMVSFDNNTLKEEDLSANIENEFTKFEKLQN